MQNRNEYLANLVRAAGFWLIVLVAALWFTAPAQAYEEVLTMSVVASTPYYGKNRQYTKHCYGQGPNECEYVGAKAQYYETVFQDGERQIRLLTVAQFPQDIWFDITRNCNAGTCNYIRALPSHYQSSETLAIREILEKEQLRYLLRPNALY